MRMGCATAKEAATHTPAKVTASGLAENSPNVIVIASGRADPPDWKFGLGGTRPPHEGSDAKRPAQHRFFAVAPCLAQLPLVGWYYGLAPLANLFMPLQKICASNCRLREFQPEVTSPSDASEPLWLINPEKQKGIR